MTSTFLDEGMGDASARLDFFCLYIYFLTIMQRVIQICLFCDSLQWAISYLKLDRLILNKDKISLLTTLSLDYQK